MLIFSSCSKVSKPSSSLLIFSKNSLNLINIDKSPNLNSYDLVIKTLEKDKNNSDSNDNIFKTYYLKDVDWKNIFRKSTTSNTNVHTNKAYYSGINKWNISAIKRNYVCYKGHESLKIH